MKIVFDNCPNCGTTWAPYPYPELSHEWKRGFTKNDCHQESIVLCVSSIGSVFFVIKVICMSGEQGTTWQDTGTPPSHKGCGHSFEYKVDIGTIPTIRDISKETGRQRHLPSEERDV